jgi:GDSL-like Lipase/Acylhydrolase family
MSSGGNEGSSASGGSNGGAGSSGSGGDGGAGGAGGGGGSASGASGASGAAGTPDAARAAGATGDAQADRPIVDRVDARTFDAGAGLDARPPGDANADAPTDTAPAYNPCPPRGMPCVIMPVGDSITAGFLSPGSGSYRVPLFQLARANMQSITFVGSAADGPAMVDGVPFPRNHEGHSGFNIDATQGRQGVSPLFPGAITTFKPHIVLLMIGTNDVDTGETTIPARLGNLMDSILGADPKLLLVVAQIVPQQVAIPDRLNGLVQAFNAEMPALVKTRADAGKHVVLVDMYQAFTSNPNFSTAYMADRIHPNGTGDAVMANTWYAAIRELLR